MPGAQDYSASESSANSSATGAVKTGNVSVVNGGSKIPIWVWLLPLPFMLIFLVWWFFFRKKQ